MVMSGLQRAYRWPPGSGQGGLLGIDAAHPGLELAISLRSARDLVVRPERPKDS